MKKAVLPQIKYPQDLRELHRDQLADLAKELRQFIIQIVANKEGHLGASLGVVELTIALHYCYNTPDDLLVWDVGHQAYAHKILTGRQDVFETNRQFGGISGFPSRSESEFDTFGVGHAATSISAALGMAITSKLVGDVHKQHLAVIGDASIVSGMAFEALNHAGVSGTNLTIILNDNAMGIDPSVGAISRFLDRLKNKKNTNLTQIEPLNCLYFGPIDGHDLDALCKIFKKMQSIHKVKLLHVITTKGKGLQKAESNQVQYHAPGKFNPKTGVRLQEKSEACPPKFQDVFGNSILELAKTNDKIVGITPAMPTGSSLTYMMHAYPDRAFDVGISEQHAVTLAAGIAARGFIPFCVIYSTFLQRAYDQLIHDVALQRLAVVFCIDRAGLVGRDGATHHGIFDIAFLSCVPNLICAAPKDEIELRNLLYTASLGLSNPIAIRYPRGRGKLVDWKKPFEIMPVGQGSCLQKEGKIAVLSTGTIATEVELALQQISDPIAHYHFPFIKPLDQALIQQVIKNHEVLVTVEEGVLRGGFGSIIANCLAKQQKRKQPNPVLVTLGVPDAFIPHGSVEELKAFCGISAQKIKCKLLDLLQELS